MSPIFEQIRLVSSHPALQHVLQRTAPLGVILRCAEMRGHDAQATQYSIEMDLSHCDERTLAALGAWLPPHVRHYGADSVEIDGHAVGTESEMVRRALTHPRSPTLRDRIAS